MKRRIFTGLVAMVMLVSVMVPSVSAASSDVADKQVYSMTVDLADVMATGGSSYKNVNLSLVLDAGDSGWSAPVTARFTTLPSNAVVESVEIDPGRVTINGGDSSFLGAILVTRLNVIAPDGSNKELTLDNDGMETLSFYGVMARGNWTLSIYGQNLTYPTGDFLDPLRMGTVEYKSAKITIYYTLE